jgi:hypothetical protein
MRNPVEMMVQNMMRQGGNNMQAVAQNILKSNPQFAQMLQGQNLQELAMQEMRRSGIEPRMFMDNMFGKR